MMFMLIIKKNDKSNVVNSFFQVKTQNSNCN